MISISLSELEALNPCSMERRRPWFGPSGRKRLNVRTALKVGASIRDILWVAQRLGRKDLCVKFALLCAQRAAHLNPDPWVKRALDATQAWLDNPCEETRADAAEAAANAAAAAYAARAADAAARAARAADAADAADAAANAAAYAAYAAEAAADAAANAADAEREAQRKILIQVFS